MTDRPTDGAHTRIPEDDRPDEDCTCPRLTEGLGKLYGISMGNRGDRITADPDCPIDEHRREAARIAREGGDR